MKIDKRRWFFLGCIIFNLLVFGILCIWGNPTFATNDDYRMRLIISGRYTGQPSGNAVFMSYILGSMLAFLYRVSPDVEWYGIFTMISMYIPVCLCEYIFLKRTKRVKEFFERLIVIAIFTFLILQKHILLPQFTITAAIWAMLAVAALIEIFNIYNTNKKFNKKWIVIFSISCLFSCFIRKKIFYMCIPMLLLLLIINWQKYRNIARRKFILGIIGILCIIFVNEGAGMLLNTNPQYKEFSDFNKARSSIYDYTGVPDYYENEDFFVDIGFDGPAWENLNNRTFDISEDINTEYLEKIYEYAKSTEDKSIIYKIWESFNDIRSVLASKTLFFQVIAFIIILGIILHQRAWRLKRDANKILIAYIIYIVIVVIGMAFIGRIMDRIIEAVLFFVMGAAYASSSVSVYKKEDTWFSLGKFPITNRLLVNIGLICISFMTIIANQYTLQRDESGIRGVVLERTNLLNSLTEYMNNKENDFLFYNALDFISASEEVFTEKENQILNIESLGNWNVFSPNYYERNKKYGFTSALEGLTECDNVYYAEIGEYHANIGDELAKKDMYLKCVDKIHVGDNTICVYKAEKNVEGD